MTRPPRYRVAHPPARPLLLWDGDCGFCALWADRWREAYGARVDVTPAAPEAARFPEIPAAAYDAGVQLVQPDGAVYSGIAAALRTRAIGQGGPSPLLWTYENVPGLAPVAEAVYGVVARHRPFFSRLTRLLCGDSLQTPAYAIGTALFLRTLAVVYFIAFASLWWQLSGLIGPDGILPAQRYLDAVAAQLGAGRWWQLPTLCWIFGAGKFLHLLCAGGLFLSVALFLRRAPAVCLLLLWMFYLSLCAAGQVFFDYQWDALLLETGLLAVLLAPWRQPAGARHHPPAAARWLLWWLFFRLMFMSGYVKLASGDPTWHDLSALTFHYQTQPLPTRVAWYVHQLPAWLQRFSCAIMFVVELGAPWLLFGPRRLRRAAALGLIAFQGFIALTGNYTFFNLLTAALALLFLDDAWWHRWIPRRRAAGPEIQPQPSRTGQRMTWTVTTVLFFASLVVTLPAVFEARAWPAWFGACFNAVAATRSVNSYGLFAVMTTTRPEIIIEGSRDGRTWEPYEFKWKPGDLQRAPAFVAPFQPRLDWQLWFAALDYPRIDPWTRRLFRRLAANTPAVVRLFARTPFGPDPPSLLRAVVYEYQFTTPAERRRTGAWWKRTPVGYYLPPTPVTQLLAP